MKNLNATDATSMKGFFTVHRTSVPFTGTAMDQTIEQTVNKQCKMSGGISGVTLNPGTLLAFQVSIKKLETKIASILY